MMHAFSVLLLSKNPYVGTPPSLVADLSRRCAPPQFTTDEWGFATCSIAFPASAADKWLWFARRQGWIEISYQGVIAWEGRLEDVAIDGETITLTGYGASRAFQDLPYTALWSSTLYGDWQEVTKDQASGHDTEHFEVDTDNRLYLAPREGEEFSNSANYGSLTTVIPNNSRRQFVRIKFDYKIVATDANWKLQLYRWTEGFVVQTGIWSLVSAAGTLTGTVDTTFSGCDRLVFDFFRNSAATTYTGNTGDVYAEITNIRVMTTTSTTLDPGEIIKDLLSFARTTNPDQLAASTVGIQSPGIDLYNEVYEDQYPLDIIKRLMEYGDANANLWELKIFERLIVLFRQRGSTGRTWYADVTPAIERALERTYNSVYPLFQTAEGRAQRGQAATDAWRVQAFGLTRQAAVQTSTTSATQAQYLRDAALNDLKSAGAIADVPLERVYNSYGALVPSWMVRSGDTLVFRGLPVGFSSALEVIRSLRIAATSYDASADVPLTVSPQARAPYVQVLETKLSNIKGGS